MTTPISEDDDVTVKAPGQPAAQPSRSSKPVTETREKRGLLPVGTTLGEFMITEMIAPGGFGVVYKARDTSLDRSVAIKEYLPTREALGITDKRDTTFNAERVHDAVQKGVQQFLEEARLLAQFKHSSLVEVYRVWEANGTAYMAMPFYPGRTLAQHLQAMSPDRGRTKPGSKG
jgi:serine/threonine protein kinase